MNKREYMHLWHEPVFHRYKHMQFFCVINIILISGTSLQIEIAFLSVLGENLNFKIDGETSFGSRMEIQLPSGSEKTFKVEFLISF